MKTGWKLGAGALVALVLFGILLAGPRADDLRLDISQSTDVPELVTVVMSFGGEVVWRGPYPDENRYARRMYSKSMGLPLMPVLGAASQWAIFPRSRTGCMRLFT